MLARRSEVANARWLDLDFDAKQSRLPEIKNGQEPIIPLSNQAIALLRTRMPEKPDPDALVLISADEGDGTTPLDNRDRATKTFVGNSKASGRTRHDLRRTGATMMGQATARHQAALNHVHVADPVDTIYNAARYRPQVAGALQRLADRLDIIGQGGATVHTTNIPRD